MNRSIDIILPLENRYIEKRFIRIWRRLFIWTLYQSSEEIQNLQKRITQLQTDMETAKTGLEEVNQKLEGVQGTLSNVSWHNDPDSWSDYNSLIFVQTSQDVNTNEKLRAMSCQLNELFRRPSNLTQPNSHARCAITGWLQSSQEQKQKSSTSYPEVRGLIFLNPTYVCLVLCGWSIDVSHRNQHCVDHTII